MGKAINCSVCLFRNSLVSTDATARGIDFGGVKCVISYDAPQFIRTYIHRYFSQRNVGRGLSDLSLKAPSFTFGLGEGEGGCSSHQMPFVFRVGRTARAGKAGLAFCLLLKRQVGAETLLGRCSAVRRCSGATYHMPLKSGACQRHIQGWVSTGPRKVQGLMSGHPVTTSSGG